MKNLKSIFVLEISLLALMFLSSANCQSDKTLPNAELIQIYIAPEVFKEAIDKLVERHAISNVRRYAIPSGFRESGISIYEFNGEVLSSDAFEGKGENHKIKQGLSRYVPRGILPTQFTDAIPEGSKLLAVLHTHPPHPHGLIPSECDMMFSETNDIPIFTITPNGKRYRYYYSNRRFRPTMSFLKANGLLLDNRDATTLAYKKFLKEHGRTYVSEPHCTPCSRFKCDKPDSAAFGNSQFSIKANTQEKST